MSAEFSEDLLQANKNEESILYVDNLHPMALDSTGEKYSQSNM